MLNIKHIRLTPFDVTTPQGMEDERYRLANLAAIANIISRVFSAGIMILAVRLSVPYLGEERFGIWMTIASFVTMLTFLDMGAGNALANKVSNAVVKDDLKHLQKTISGGLGVLFIIACGVYISLNIIVIISPWDVLLKTSNTTDIQQEILTTLYCFVFLYSFHIFSTSTLKVFSGLQKLYQAHVLSVIGYSVSLIMIIITTQNQLGLPMLLTSAMSGPLITGLILLHIPVSYTHLTLPTTPYV